LSAATSSVQRELWSSSIRAAASAATALCDSANCGASVVPMLAGAPIGSAPMAAGRGLAATPLL